MKFLLVLTCACAILANVNSKLSVTKIDFDELMAKAEDILISNPKLEDEIQFLKNQIEIVREIQVKPLNPKLKRRKRQTTSINCTALCIELTTIQSDIALTKIRITNSSITLNGLAIQLKKYEEKVSNTTGSTQKTLEDLTRITRLYKNLVTSINSTLETLKKNLVILQANETKTKFDIDTFCVALDPAKYPCGTFIPYDPNNGKTHPNVNGFAGGINLDGSTAFIGYGNASSCSNQLLAPCSLRTNGNSPGCNIPCGSNQIIDGKNSFYLLNNQNLAWVPTDVTNMLNVLNSLKLLGPNNFMFGRANVDGNYILGKVHAGNGISAFQALTSNGQFQLTTGFEILTCLVVNSCSCSGQYLGSTVIPSNPITNPPTAAPTVPPNPITNPPTEVPTVPPNPITNPPTEVPTVPPNPITNPPTEVPTVPPNPINNPPTAAPTVPPNPITNPPTEVPTVPPNPITNPPTEVPTVPPNPITNPPTAAPTVPPNPITNPPTEVPTVPPNPITNPPTAAPTVPPTVSSNNVLSSGSSFKFGQTITGTDGSYLILSNGDLVYFNNAGNVIWQAGVSEGSSVVMNSDGTLTILDANGNSIWTVNGTPGSSLQIQNGQVFLVNGGAVSWASSSSVTMAPTIAPTNPTFDPSSYPCATFTNYDSINSRTAPELYGFVGGTNYDQTSPQYVGYGNNPCGNPLQTACPGYINTISNPGIYMSCENGLQFDNTEVYFLLNHSNLQWVDTDSANLFLVSKRIYVNDTSNHFYFGRVFYNGQYRLGKVHGSSPGIGFFVVDQFNNELSYSNGFQILTCGSSNQGSTISPTLAPTEVITPTLTPTTNVPIGNSLSSGGSFTSGQSITGSDGSYLALHNGDLVYYDSTGNIIWNAGITGGSYVGLNSDGTLSVSDSNNNSIWLINGAPGSTLSIQNGEVVLVKGGSIVWSSLSGSSNSQTTESPSIDNTLSSGSSFTSGQRYYGSDGSYFALVDGDFVYYDSAGQIAWRAGVSGGSYIAMGSDGSLSVYDVDGHELWSVYGTPGSSLSIQNGELVLMYGGSTIWGSSSGYSSSSGSISSGSSFTSGQRYYGSDGSYFALVDGDFVYYDSAGQIVWRAGVSGGSYIAMGSDGSLSVYDVDGHELWSVYGTPGSSLSIQNGELVLMYGGSTIWGSSSGYTAMSSRFIISGDSLYRGGSRISSNGQYQLIFQSDGNLVIKSVLTGKITWSTYTAGSGATRVTMNSDGNLVMYDNNYNIIWSSGSSFAGSNAMIRYDGSLVVYSGQDIFWDSSPKQIANGCGSLIYFDIYNNSLIESIGFTGGIFTDGSVAYAGIADNIACNQQYCPARISTISNAPGGYMSCGTSQYDSAYAYFIRAHSNLYWIPTDTANMKYVWGRLEVNSSTDSFMVGRKTMDNNFSQISKIHNGPGFSFNFIDTNNQESAVQNDFDILVCDSSPACGTYVYYDTKNQPNAPLTNGYIGGIAKDGSIAFVGRGNNAVQNQNPCPARISAYPNSAGAYMPAGTETYDTNSAYYILDHPDLHWVSTDVYNMNNVYGALHLTAGSFAFSHGRVMINNYAYLGKIHDGSSFNYIDDNGQESGLSSGFEILVCDSSLTTQMRTCNNTIQAGTCLYPGESIWSCSGCFILSFQVDNNLVVYSKSGAIIWSTATHYQGPVRACIESDGHFNLYNSNNAVQWSTPWFVANTDTQAVATILDDGQFVVVAGGQTKFTSGITAVCEI